MCEGLRLFEMTMLDVTQQQSQSQCSVFGLTRACDARTARRERKPETSDAHGRQYRQPVDGVSFQDSAVAITCHDD
jgi:hypothetical protein